MSYIQNWSTPTFHNCQLPLKWVSQHLQIKKGIANSQDFKTTRIHITISLHWELTAAFAESHLKKRVKKGGSLPSMTTYTGATWDNFSRRKSCSRNFCSIQKKSINPHQTLETLNMINPYDVKDKRMLKQKSYDFYDFLMIQGCYRT